MKRIVLSANTSWYLYNFRSSTIRAMQEKGYKVFCLSPKDKYSALLSNELGCSWIEINVDSKGSNPVKDLFMLIKIIIILNKIKPIVIFNFTIKNNIYGTWAARLLNIDVVNNVSGLGTAFITNNMTSKVVVLLYKLSQCFAKKVFCQNPEDFQLLIERNLVPEDKLFLLPGSGVDIKKFNPSLKKSGPPNGRFRFLFVGRILGDKGIRELIEASKKLADSGYNFTLTLCGFSGVDNVSALTEDELLKISKIPYVNWLGASDKVEEVYSRADCVVLPSYREGMPRSLLEAGAMGLPSITTDVPGCKHVITHGFNGLICQVKDVQSLYIQMISMLEMDAEAYQEMCTNSRYRIQKEYRDEIVIEQALLAISE